MGRTQGQGIVLNAPQIEVGEVLLLVYKVVVKSKKSMRSLDPNCRQWLQL